MSKSKNVRHSADSRRRDHQRKERRTSDRNARSAALSEALPGDVAVFASLERIAQELERMLDLRPLTPGDAARILGAMPLG